MRLVILHALRRVLRDQTMETSKSQNSVPECLEAELKFNLSAGNSAFNNPEFFMKIEEKVHAKEEETRQLQARTQVSSASKANVLNQHKSTEERPIARKVIASRASCTEKVSHRLYQSVNRPSTAADDRATSATENTVRCLRAEVFNRCSTNEHLNMADSPQVSKVTIHLSAELSDSSMPSAATSKTSKQTQSNRTVAPKREQEKRQVANSPRPRTSILSGGTRTLKLKTKQRFLHEEQETMQ
ncbi:hypothetical protein CQW23_31254 [Capsicum baccatum]|uniref:TPX2 C-terminal domain-containing protein n=1 Tax=Capsicum baccatum TaxID=33114 RepID=A0A2G2V820_CAPBA|nr:hypothetical protein CQW23_31254 [Capsicum baccatum]